MYGGNMVDGDIERHHKDQLVPFFAPGGEYAVAVVPAGKVASYLCNSPVLAYLDDGFVLPYERVENFPMYARVIVFKRDKLAHDKNIYEVYTLYLLPRRTALRDTTAGGSTSLALRR